ncbi:MAG: tRNA lysidine(34) synthetase TilS [Deltaproteobacteria bacterium]|nr:tRNA lysidine(34) synthetase TilS [Deltaproteobacteria bacterium]
MISKGSSSRQPNMTRNPIPQILSRVKRTIHQHQMILPGEQLGVAVSGGIDSVVLLDTLASLREELHISLMVLHLNHGIRGEEAKRDQRFVQDLSKSYALACISKKVDVPSYMREASLSLQEAARELRYRFFEEVMETHDLDKVVLGQTADDQAETVLMRFIKGGGTRGLKGIPYVRGGYIRPLLDVWREELQEYAQQRGLAFVEDSSNLKKTYLRNRIRHELLPYLSDYNPNIKERLLQLAQILGEDELYLEKLAQEVAKGMVKRDNEEVSIPIPQLLCLPSALRVRVLQRSFERISSGKVLEYPHLKGVLRMAQEGGGSKRMPLPGGLWAVRVYDTLILRKEEGIKEERLKETALQVPGRTTLDGLKMVIEATIYEGQTSPRPDPQEAYLDYDRLVFPLRLRSYRPGDSFIPLGMKGRKKLKEFFIDLKIPRTQRGKIPLVTSGADICWVVDWRIDERFKVGEGTKKTLKLTLIRL